MITVVRLRVFLFVPSKALMQPFSYSTVNFYVPSSHYHIINDLHLYQTNVVIYGVSGKHYLSIRFGVVSNALNEGCPLRIDYLSNLTA